MSKIKVFLQAVLDQALAEFEKKNNTVSLYTLAFYHDHESKAVSICIDTEENSKMKLVQENKYNMEYFQEALEEKDLAAIASWNANIERNSSIGDFAFINLAYTPLTALKGGKQLYLSMIQVVLDNEERIAMLTNEKDKLAFFCSGPNYEVEYKWKCIN